MALDRAMHPRNRYRDKPPDFSFLASKYPDFSQYIHVDLAGNVKLNFKDPEAVRALTCTLLKEDFGLTVEIPLQRLIPTIPLRLNYIHWVEDLMETMGIKAQGPGSHAFIRGIDIGTGTSCIYPLLGATMNGWHFLATEVDDVCYSHACCNVERNRLQDLIQVVKVPEKTLLLEALKENPSVMYDFCMCNPPFFATAEEAKGAKSRSAHRPPPSSVNTGGNTEILAEGGELEFVRRIIQDSLHLMKRLRWYTCMLGKKCSLAPLKEELRRCGVPRVTSTVFCQGRTSRWALAWTFYTDVSIPSPPPKRRKMEKLKRPFTISLPSTVVEQLLGQNGPSVKDSVQEVCRFLEKVLAELKVQFIRVSSAPAEVSLFITAHENTWVHARRKRRKEQQASLTEMACDGDSRSMSSMEFQAASHSDSEHTQSPEGHNSAGVCSVGKVESGDNEVERDLDLPGMRMSGSSKHSVHGDKPVLKSLVNVKGVDDGDQEGNASLFVELHWVEGQNRDSLNQLASVLRNRLLSSCVSPAAPN
uniref:U6 small nuclear RNA (adenine-(43)-N(6))-methyltransferase n=1 Tax=Eptatretus burgeri TaxID=7764 RepID=A0A8C4PY68_EPTBU